MFVFNIEMPAVTKLRTSDLNYLSRQSLDRVKNLPTQQLDDAYLKSLSSLKVHKPSSPTSPQVSPEVKRFYVMLDQVSTETGIKLDPTQIMTLEMAQKVVPNANSADLAEEAVRMLESAAFKKGGEAAKKEVRSTWKDFVKKHPKMTISLVLVAAVFGLSMLDLLDNVTSEVGDIGEEVSGLTSDMLTEMINQMFNISKNVADQTGITDIAGNFWWVFLIIFFIILMSGVFFIFKK